MRLSYSRCLSCLKTVCIIQNDSSEMSPQSCQILRETDVYMSLFKKHEVLSEFCLSFGEFDESGTEITIFQSKLRNIAERVQQICWKSPASRSRNTMSDFTKP